MSITTRRSTIGNWHPNNKAKLEQILPTPLHDEFFINHHKMYSLSHKIDASSINPKRLVFISIIGLWRSWKHCPSISLYSAIIIVPLKKAWIEEPNKYCFDYDYNKYNYMLQDTQFLNLLRWKDQQKLAVFMLDDESEELEPDKVHKNPLMSPVWRRLSQRLQELHDPVGNNMNGKYNPLIFDEKYWRYQSSVCKHIHNKKSFQNMHMSEYCANVDDILLELYCVSMRFNTIKHILTESNPSLEVIENYWDKNMKAQNNSKIVLYPAPNTHNTQNSKSQIDKPQNAQHTSHIINTEIENEGKYDDNDNKNNNINEYYIKLDDNWWISDDYYDNSTLTEDMQALREFQQYRNQFTPPPKKSYKYYDACSKTYRYVSRYVKPVEHKDELDEKIMMRTQSNDSNSDNPNNKIVKYPRAQQNNTQKLGGANNNANNNDNNNYNESGNDNGNGNCSNKNGNGNGNGNGNDDEKDKRNDEHTQYEMYDTCSNPQCIARNHMQIKEIQRQRMEIEYLKQQLIYQKQINRTSQTDQKKLLMFSQMKLDHKCNDMQLSSKQLKNRKKNKKKKLKSLQKQIFYDTKDTYKASYEPLSLIRARRNIQITKKMTEEIIPSKIANYDHEEKKINYYKYMDKAVAMQLMDHSNTIDNDIVVIDFDFYDKQKKQKLYCVMDKQKQPIEHFKWKMRDKLYTGQQIKLSIDSIISIPHSSRKTSEYSPARRNKIKELLHVHYEQIMDIKWCNASIFHRNKFDTKRRIVLRAENGHFNKCIRSYISKQSIHAHTLIPIIMFNKCAYWIEWVLIVEITDNVCIGISFKYNENEHDHNQLTVSGLHLDKDLLLEQHHLVSPQHMMECQCLDDWVSCITHIEICDDLNANHNAIGEIKQKYQSLKTFIKQLIEEPTNDDDYKSMKHYAQLLIQYHDGYEPMRSPSLSNSSVSLLSNTSNLSISSLPLLGYNSSTVASLNSMHIQHDSYSLQGIQ